METVELQVTQRTKLGSKGANDARRAATIPAIVYGHGMTPLPVAVPEKLFNTTIRSGHGLNLLFQLQVEGVKLKESTCRVKDYQTNPVTDKISHIDFMVISMTEKIEVSVRIKIKGADSAPGVKAGGSLDLVHHEVEIECLPNQVPDFIEVNVKDMNIGDAIHFSDIKLPEGATSNFPLEEVIVAVHAPRAEEELKAEEGDAAKEPEVLTAKKKDEPAEGAAAPAAPKADKK
ncbi:MAG TPA: 50S ribosomal protein L25/general stress protein Ctc [Candidatus Omnitrophota bacterium]|nr:50S ribosomal protein L25/general stress protein Ctc [Candidatus Omnitrophota bacterium]